MYFPDWNVLKSVFYILQTLKILQTMYIIRIGLKITVN